MNLIGCHWTLRADTDKAYPPYNYHTIEVTQKEVDDKPCLDKDMEERPLIKLPAPCADNDTCFQQWTFYETGIESVVYI